MQGLHSTDMVMAVMWCGDPNRRPHTPGIHTAGTQTCKPAEKLGNATCVCILKLTQRRGEGEGGGLVGRGPGRGGHLVVPSPGFRVDRLPNSAQHTQAAPAVLLHSFIALGHEAPDGCRSCVQDGHLLTMRTVQFDNQYADKRHALYCMSEQCCACRDYPAVLPGLLVTAAHTVCLAAV